MASKKAAPAGAGGKKLSKSQVIGSLAEKTGLSKKCCTACRASCAADAPGNHKHVARTTTTRGNAACQANDGAGRFEAMRLCHDLLDMNAPSVSRLGIAALSKGRHLQVGLLCGHQRRHHQLTIDAVSGKPHLVT